MMTQKFLLASLLLFAAIPTIWAEETKPLAELQAAAEGGDAESQFQLSRAYLQGSGVPKDLPRAFALMKSAAAQGHPDALGGVGYFYSKGLATGKDGAEAVRWFRKGAEKGSAKARFNLGTSLLDGESGESTGQTPEARRDEGLRWIRMAADQGLPEACLSYGIILYLGEQGQPQDFPGAMALLRTAAEHGLAEAQNMLGAMYEAGQSVAIDPVAAAEWYRKAALQGHAKAQANLGMILGPQTENKATRIEALAWLLLAQEQEAILAQKILAGTVSSLKSGELDEAKARADGLRKLVKH